MLLLHILSWAVSLVLFIALMFVHAPKLMKIGSMIMRTLYLSIIGSGIILCFTTATFSIPLIIKILGSFWIIYTYEMILVQKAKTNSIKHTKLWIQFVVAWIIVFVFSHML